MSNRCCASASRNASVDGTGRWSCHSPPCSALPDNAVSTVAAQGQLGLGGTYYASNGNNTEPAAAFLKQGYVRYRGEGSSLRLGRFEFFDGMETKPKNPDHSLAAEQPHRQPPDKQFRVLERAAQL